MNLSPKPEHRCYTCLLNMGKYCWKYACPRQQWRHKKCPGFENPKLYQAFQEWQTQPHVKARKQLRQEAFRSRKKEPGIPSWKSRVQRRR